MSPPSFLILALVAATVCVVSSRSINFLDTEVENEIEFSHNHNRDEITKNFKCPAMHGRYPHPKSCEYFFECRSGNANLMQCNRNNLYDEKKQQCLDKRRVHCHRGHKGGSGSGSGSKESKSSEEKDDGKEFKCPKIWGSFPDPRDCSKYYVCLYDVPTSYKCHKNELFDEKAQKCLDRRRVDCGKRKEKDGSKTSKSPKTTTEKIQTTTPVPTTTEVYDRFLCPSPNGRYADPSDCSKYYECRHSVPTLKQCRGSELYDERKEKCQNKRDVRCGNRGKVEKTTEGLTSPTNSTRTEGTTSSAVEEITTSTEKEVTVTDEFTSSEEITTVEETTLSEEITTVEETTPSEEITTAEESTPSEEITTMEETTPSEEITTMEETTQSEEITTMEETTPSEEITTMEESTPPEETTTVTVEESTPSEEITTVEESTPSEEITTVEESTTSEELTTPSDELVTGETISSTTLKPTLPNTPPPTNCDEDDLDCIIDETGDVTGWFACPDRYGHFPHGSSKKLFIHCDNFKPFVKTCADNTEFSPVHLVCTWPS